MNNFEAIRLAAIDNAWNSYADIWPIRLNDTENLALRTYNGSLQDAKLLHEALIHERVLVKMDWSKRYGAVVVLEDVSGSWSGINDDPARAWFIAMITCLIETEAERLSHNSTEITQLRDILRGGFEAIQDAYTEIEAARDGRPEISEASFQNVQAWKAKVRAILSQ